MTLVAVQLISQDYIQHDDYLLLFSRGSVYIAPGGRYTSPQATMFEWRKTHPNCYTKVFPLQIQTGVNVIGRLLDVIGRLLDDTDYISTVHRNTALSHTLYNLLSLNSTLCTVSL